MRTCGDSRIMYSPIVSIAGLPSWTCVANGPDGSGCGGIETLDCVSLKVNTNGESVVGAAPPDAFSPPSFLVRLEEHRLEQLHQRHVQKVEPVGAGAAVVAVAVARPVRRQQHVARLHGDLDAVDFGVGARLGIEMRRSAFGVWRCERAHSPGMII